MLENGNIKSLQAESNHIQQGKANENLVSEP